MTGSLKRFLFRRRSIYIILKRAKSAGVRVSQIILNWLTWLGLTEARRERVTVFGLTAIVILVFLYTAWLMKGLLSGYLVAAPLALAFGFLAAEVIVITIQVVVSCALKDWTTKANRKKAALMDSIQSHFAAHAFGEDRWKPLRRLRNANFAAVEECLEDQMAALEGEARLRLSRLAGRLGYRRHWEAMAFRTDAQKRRRAAHALGLLDGEESRPILFHLARDKEPLVQAAACRAILRRPSSLDCEAVFLLGLQGPLVVRMVLATALRPYSATPIAPETDGLPRRAADPSCAGFSAALDRELRGADSGRRLAALELTQNWQATLRPDTLLWLLMHGEDKTRAAALRLLPFQPLIQPDLWITIGLGHANPAIRTAAAAAAGQLRFSFSAEAVAGCVQPEDLALAHRSLLALAAMGGHGVREIETKLRDGARPVAALAMEALALAILRPEAAQRPPSAPALGPEMRALPAPAAPVYTPYSEVPA